MARLISWFPTLMFESRALLEYVCGSNWHMMCCFELVDVYD